jgi:hypothetical protein
MIKPTTNGIIKTVGYLARLLGMFLVAPLVQQQCFTFGILLVKSSRRLLLLKTDKPASRKLSM